MRRSSFSHRARRFVAASFLVVIAPLGVSKAIGQTFDSWTAEHFRLALQAQRHSKLDVAAKEYQLVISRDPRFAGAYLNLGIVYHEQRKYSKAVAALRTAVALNPKLVGARIFLGVDEYLSEDFGPAVENLRTALLLKPQDKVAGTYLGLSYIALSEPLDAIRVLSAMAQYYPKDPNIHYRLGEAYLAAMKQGLARLKKLGAQSAFYHWALAIGAERKRDQVTMIEEYMRALSRDPNLPALYWKLSAALREAGFHELAAAALERYRLLNPSRNVSHTVTNEDARVSPGKEAVLLQNATAFHRLWKAIPPIHPDPSMPDVGDAYVRHALQKGSASPEEKNLRDILHLYSRGNYESVTEKIANSRLYEKNWAVAYILASAYQEESHYRRAFKVVEEHLLPYLQAPAVSLLAVEVESHLALWYLNQAVAMQPDSYLSKLLLARYYAAAGQDSKALAIYQEALKLAPDRLGVHLAIGEIYEDELRWAPAIAEYRAELALDSSNELALAHLGHTLTEAHEAAQAVPVLEQLLKANPTDGQAWADLGKAWEIDNEPSKAITAYGRALRYDSSQISLHYRLFRLYRNVGNNEQALKELATFKAAEAKKKREDQERVKVLESGQQ